MSSIASFSKARKARDRKADKARADANATRHGRTKAERMLEATRDEKARQLLDGHECDSE
ncbi:DUF4169 family protein [Rhodophyticola sp. CCM32]|uniref:DUF4169 family protein n=1 Tax=Rhodophyticola sp. CCM32 TaxID=2916397 RepID=UPI00107FBDDC|nr:DUF4169 family protein [Rhodophyticola sp. CCM32]QBY00686.1 DUF4169 family protein [Rhodophyticola sp. CCM32]